MTVADEHVDTPPAGGIARRAEGCDLGMRTAELLVIALADKLALADDHTPHEWIRLHHASTLLGKLQGLQHEAAVSGSGGHSYQRLAIGTGENAIRNRTFPSWPTVRR